ncbi:MAG: hypothetical protein JWO69_973 [Thermoleophilia bacterium]|jgi:hypothetical protein|nr:hypothetical protein [Thermoleophilia bacterium]
MTTITTNYVPTAHSIAAAWPATGPGLAAPVPVTGGGIALQATRVRWGRILLMLVGLALVGFGSWQAFAGGVATDATPRTVGGGGGMDIPAPARTIAPAVVAPSTPTTTPAAKSAPRTAAKRAAAKRAAAKRATAKRVAARAAAAAPVATMAAARGAGASPTAAMPVAGGGAGALPYTGIETWIAAILGVLLLTIGVCVHVNAVRIGMTAMLYRRGILLRPVDCARLAQQRGLPQMRIALSNVLTRLLEEPARASDFATSRHA